jgi:hypothetical protein
MSNRSLATLLIGLLAGLLALAAFQIASAGRYAGLCIGITLVPMAMAISALVALACGLRK